MDHDKILVFSGRSGSGKTYQLKKLVNDQNARFLHADELLDIIVTCAKCAYTEELKKADPATLLLATGATMFAFDDIDYEFKGKPQCQKEICKVIWNLAKRGHQVAIGVIDIEDVPVIKQFLTSSPIAGLVEWRFL
jgi:hypothetical protein